MKNKIFFILLSFTLIFATSCKEQKQTDLPLRITLSKYFDAVNSNNYQKMAECLTYYDEILNRFGEVGSSRVAFTKTVDKINKQYEEDRDKGHISFDKFGIVAVRILGLGRGLYYTTDDFFIKGNEGYLILLHSFNYDEMDYSVFPEGTILYFLGCPFGTVYRVTTGVPIEQERHYVTSIKTKWYFKLDDNKNWKISKMEVLDFTAKCRKSYKRLY